MLSAKRQKLRAEELQKIKDNILNNLPTLNKRQIRRHRIPYHEALYLELLEDDFEETANFLKTLIDYQENIFKKFEEEQIIWTKPLLKTDKDMLNTLYEGLKNAETGIKNNQIGTEVDEMLELAIFFSNQVDDWWWVAEQLFMQCVQSVKDFHDDGGRRHAIVRYIFGRFLLKQMNDVERAKENLRIGRGLSNGQNWTAAEVLKIHQGNLFKETCNLLYQALLIMSKDKIKTDAKAALKLASMGYKRAQSADAAAGEAECLFQQGLCEMELGMAQLALMKFNKVLIMHFSTNNKPGICEARIQLALANNKLDNMTEAKYHFHHLLDYTHKHDMAYYRALGHRYLGELYLIRNIGQEASTHLLKALEIFHELDDYDNREQAKNLAAIASGCQLLRPLMKLINSCERKHYHYLHNVMKLVLWKDSREEFWDEDTDLSNLKRYMEIYGEYVPKDKSTGAKSYSAATNSSRSTDTNFSFITTMPSLPSRQSVTTISQITFSTV